VIFLDVNVFVYAARDPDAAEPAPPAHDLILAVAGERLDAATSTAVLEELWHLELRGRPAGLSGATRAAYRLMTPLLPVTDATVASALEVELELDLDGLGANDRVHVAACLENGIETIVTADSGFEDASGLRRIDPLDARAMRELLPSA